MIDSATDLQAGLDSEQALLLRQKQAAIATERVVRLEVLHQTLVTRCRQAKQETADLALELEQATFVFMADRGELDAAIANAASTVEAKPKHESHPTPETFGIWNRNVSEARELQSQAERRYGDSYAYYLAVQWKWKAARERFEALAGEETDLRDQLQPVLDP
jgi:hypothetical protein